MKPPVKEGTEPIDIVLRSDVRAAERAEFDQFVSFLNDSITISEKSVEMLYHTKGWQQVKLSQVVGLLTCINWV